jgi:hypothetical protein
MTPAQGRGVVMVGVVVFAVAVAVGVAVKTFYRIFFVKPGPAPAAGPARVPQPAVSSGGASPAIAAGVSQPVVFGYEVPGLVGDWAAGSFVDRRGRWIRREKLVRAEWFRPFRVVSTQHAFTQGEDGPLGYVVAVFRRSWGAEVILEDRGLAGVVYLEWGGDRLGQDPPAKVEPLKGEPSQGKTYVGIEEKEEPPVSAPAVPPSAVMRGLRRPQSVSVPAQ